MIIKFFRRDFTTQLFIFIFLAILFWIDGFIYPTAVMQSDNDSLFYSMLAQWVALLPPIVNVILAWIILVLQSLILNNAITELKILPRNTFFLALIYFLLLSYFPGLLRIHPILISNLLLIVAFRSLININEKNVIIPVKHRTILSKYNGSWSVIK